MELCRCIDMEDTGFKCTACDHPALWELELAQKKLTVTCPQCGKVKVIDDVPETISLRLFCMNQVDKIGAVS